MNEWPWTALLATGGGISIITFITFWMTLSSRITTADERSKAVEEHMRAFQGQIREAQGPGLTAIAKCELLQRDFNDERVETAQRLSTLQTQTEVTTRALAQAETRLAKSIEDLGHKMDNLSEAILRTLGELVGKRDAN